MSGQQSDIEEILSRRRDNGADYWATPDGRIYVGNPFSTIGCLSLLHELGLTSDHEAVCGGLDLILDVCREDGRIRVAPQSPMYPCYTAEAARVLCRYGLTNHAAVRRMPLRGREFHTRAKRSFQIARCILGELRGVAEQAQLGRHPQLVEVPRHHQTVSAIVPATAENRHRVAR